MRYQRVRLKSKDLISRGYAAAQCGEACLTESTNDQYGVEAEPRRQISITKPERQSLSALSSGRAANVGDLRLPD